MSDNTLLTVSFKRTKCIYRSTWTPKTETLGHLDKNI
jgi:hypothetical protein